MRMSDAAVTNSENTTNVLLCTFKTLRRDAVRAKSPSSCRMKWSCLVASVWRRSPVISGLFPERPAVSAALLSRSAAVFRRRSSLFPAGLSHTVEAFFPPPLSKKKSLLPLRLACYRLILRSGQHLQDRHSLLDAVFC